MRILHVTPRYFPATGGAEHYFGEISTRLAAAGHDVTVLTSDAYSFEYFWDPARQHVTEPASTHDGVRVLRFPVRHAPWLSPLLYRAARRLLWLHSRLTPLPVGMARPLSRRAPATPALWRWLAETDEPFDVVAGINVAYEQFLAAGLAHAQRTRRPFIAYPLTHLGSGPYPGATPISQFYTMRHQRALMQDAGALVAITATELAFYRRLGYTGRGAVVAPGVAPPPALPEPDAARARLAARYGDPDLLNVPLVFSLATLSHDKGTIHLIEAVRRLWAAGRPVALLLAGQPVAEFDSYWAGLPEEVRQRIHRPGTISDDEKQDALAAAACFAMPSRIDSFGIVYLEAWAHGKPVIGARTWGITEDVIHHEQDGLLVPFGDVEALARAIGTLLNQPELAQALGRRGQAQVQQRYTWERAMDTLLPLYEELGTL